MNLNNVTYEMSAGTFQQLPPCTLPEIVFSGRSNVGKSSLINRILNRKNLARVSSQPGKTITINFYKADTARLVDLPGYGYAKHSFDERNRWGKMIEKYLATGRDIRLLIQLIDMRHEPTKDDIQMLDYLYQTDMPYMVVLTKADKLNKKEYAQALAMHEEIISRYNPILIVPFSAVTGAGTEEITCLMISSVDGNFEFLEATGSGESSENVRENEEIKKDTKNGAEKVKVKVKVKRK
ncbi:MAG: ribosome biogenesis GTP-binding protein YihA/YsxC [Clostridia bacterium]|nr:ribosome biogenesis GTP-binding protein YihA/YsxC [Clostridia bacterium]